MTDRELMQQALEALEHVAGAMPFPVALQVRAALRERLAQPEHEPVAWGVFDGPNLHDVNFTEEDAQEMVRLKGDGSVVKPLYTSPPASKPWVGLTDEEIDDIYQGAGKHDLKRARAVEAKLKEKNT